WMIGPYLNRLIGEWVFGYSAALPYVMFLSLPFLFALSKDSKADNFIGEFSYPVYLVHHLIIMVLAWGAPAHCNVWVVLILSFLLSAVILFALRPIERVRAVHPIAT